MSAGRNNDVLSGPARAQFMAWWHGLTSETASGTARSDRAVLRRADTLAAVACTPAYQRIYRRMAEAHDGEAWGPYEQDRIAALVGLSAHVTKKVPMSLPQAMSHHAEGNDRNPVSELRFTRLLEAPDMEALFAGLRRSLPLIKNEVDPATLVDDICGWSDAVKKRWAYAYRWPQRADG